MAFIPDDAIDNAFTLSPTAFQLYCLICRRRNHKTGNAFIRVTYAAQVLARSRSQIYRAIDELKHAEWIAANGSVLVPIFGSFQPVDRSSHQRDKPSQTDSQPSDTTSHPRDTLSHECESPYMNNQPSSSSALNTSARPAASEICQYCDGKKAVVDNYTNQLRACIACSPTIV